MEDLMPWFALGVLCGGLLGAAAGVATQDSYWVSGRPHCETASIASREYKRCWVASEVSAEDPR